MDRQTRFHLPESLHQHLKNTAEADGVSIAFQSYLDCTRHVLAIESEFISEEDIDFGPSEYQLKYPSF